MIIYKAEKSSREHPMTMAWEMKQELANFLKSIFSSLKIAICGPTEVPAWVS